MRSILIRWMHSDWINNVTRWMETVESRDQVYYICCWQHTTQSNEKIMLISHRIFAMQRCGNLKFFSNKFSLLFQFRKRAIPCKSWAIFISCFFYCLGNWINSVLVRRWRAGWTSGCAIGSFGCIMGAKCCSLPIRYFDVTRDELDGSRKRY